jgi:ribosomal protein S18 acetylase RimI-like enzyme
MTTPIHQSPQASTPGHLRPFNAQSDLKPVADLVELCFAETLDHDGRLVIRRMRAAAKRKGVLGWATVKAEWADMMLSGYVWEQNSQIVGNISLIPYHTKGKRIFLIANVAVHPDHRRRGIARKLTIEGIKHAQKQGVHRTWLHVREENKAALDLYQSLGYSERTRRTTWFSNPDYPTDFSSNGLSFGRPKKRYWSTQLSWLKKNYPLEISWHLNINSKALQPGFLGAINRFFYHGEVRQWIVVQGRKFSGALSWISSTSHADNLLLAAPPDADETILTSLLIHARTHLWTSRSLRLEYPARLNERAIQDAGFYTQQTLIWMSANH